ncbi:MAG: septum formation inhibitor Maf [Gammaproteobacteria bacterium]|nr:septum formation inhibitor Maf [Gammaproteobacteria bacterium]
MIKLVLASTSPFRQTLLRKLELPFETQAPNIDETPLSDESPNELVARLSKAKANIVSKQYNDALIIGSDQVAILAGQIIGKPLNHDNAVSQLQQTSGKRVDFVTGLCLLNSRTGQTQITCVPFSVYFRNLSKTQIERYLKKDKPYNCAGSFKSEGFGISLFEKLSGDDPNALIGLPLIELIRMLHHEGVDVP